MSLNHESFNECPSCRQGELLVVQDLKSREYSIMCDECEDKWKNPQDCQYSTKALDRNNSRVRDATQEEIRELGWAQFFKDEPNS